MSTLRQLAAWRTRPWRAVVWKKSPTPRSCTLRELLGLLETSRDRDPLRSPYLDDLTALVKEDLASSERFPERQGGPDTRRPWSAWRARYNHLDRYVGPAAAPECLRSPAPDDGSARALSAAENEGWPMAARDG